MLSLCASYAVTWAQPPQLAQKLNRKATAVLPWVLPTASHLNQPLTHTRKLCSWPKSATTCGSHKKLRCVAVPRGQTDTSVPGVPFQLLSG